MQTRYIVIKSHLIGHFTAYCRDMEIDLSYIEGENGELHVLHWHNEAAVNQVLAAMTADGIEFVKEVE